MELIVHQNPEPWLRASTPSITARSFHTHMWRPKDSSKRSINTVSTPPSRRTSRRGKVARERAHFLVSQPSSTAGIPKRAARAVAPYNARKRKGESMRVVPALELDRARRLAVHLLGKRADRAALPESERPVVERDGTLNVVDDERMRLRPGAQPAMRKVRFRTGCYPLSGERSIRAPTRCRRSSEMFVTRSPSVKDG